MSNILFKKLKSICCMLLISTLLLPNASISAAVSNSETQSTYENLNKVVLSELTSTPSEQSNTTSFKQSADEKGQYTRKLMSINSLSSSIIENNELVYDGNFGFSDISGKKEPTKDTMYGIGSVSKVYTTAAVMQLVEQGKIDLDTSVATYIPNFKMADERYKDITVRMLLNHSSGLMGSHFSNTYLFNDNDTYCIDTFLKQLSVEHLKYQPGSSSVYCNDGFSLAEILVSKVSGMTFTKYLEKNIFAPLGLNSTKTPQSSYDKKKLAKIYTPFLKELPYEMTNCIGAGGLFSSAQDLCKFGAAFGKGNTNLLSEESKKAMANPEYKKGFWIHSDNSLFAYGLGWDNVSLSPFKDYGITAYTKCGDVLSYHAILTVLPEYNIAVSALSTGGSSTALMAYTNTILLDYLASKGYITKKTPKEEEKLTVSPFPSEVSDYAGTYVSPMAQAVVSYKDNKMTITTGGTTFPLHYSATGYYFSDKSPIRYRFFKEKNSVYLEASASAPIGELGTLTDTTYVGVKLNDNPISKELKSIWKKREGVKYFPVSEKYTSLIYTHYQLSSLTPTFALNKDVEGYVSNLKIAGKNLCYTDVEVPVMNGRDGSHIKFYKKGNIEYILYNGSVYMSEKGIKTLPSKGSKTVVIPKTGYAQIYKIPKKANKKTAKFTVPKHASFIVYDNKGTAITNYYIDKSKTVKLPAGGYIFFMGKKNKKLKLTIK